MAVSRAIALDLLKKEEIPENLADILDLKIGFFTDQVSGVRSKKGIS